MTRWLIGGAHCWCIYSPCWQSHSPSRPTEKPAGSERISQNKRPYTRPQGG